MIRTLPPTTPPVVDSVAVGISDLGPFFAVVVGLLVAIVVLLAVG